MLGETTLAMLYVPLFFYLFDTLAERSAKKKEAKSPPEPKPAALPGGRAPDRPTPATEGGH
jgi:multidrug efflux pump